MRRMSTGRLLPALVVASACPIAAQPPSIVSPRQAAVALGERGSPLPFAAGPLQYQQIHDRTSFGNAPQTFVVRLAFRMAAGATNRPGSSIDVELWLGDAPHDSSRANGRFAANVVAASEVNVLHRKLVNLPQVPNNDWAVTFPFDTPFWFTGQSDFTWRAVVHGNGNQNRPFDWQLDAWWFAGRARRQGTYPGCSGLGASAPAQLATSDPSLRTGLVATFTARSFVTAGGLPAVLAIGASGSSWAGVPLPFDLGRIGAPGCMLVNDVLATVPGTTLAGAEGAAQFAVPLPADPGLEGGTFQAQAVFLQTGANALGLFTSEGLQNRIGLPPGVTRLYDLSGTNGTYGVPEFGFGLAIGLN